MPLNGGQARVRIHALDTGKSPVLLSVRSLAQLGAQIDFSAGLAVFHRVDPRKIIRLERTDAGHFVMPLTSDIFDQATTVQRAIPALSDWH